MKAYLGSRTLSDDHGEKTQRMFSSQTGDIKYSPFRPYEQLNQLDLTFDRQALLDNRQVDQK